MCDGYTLYQHRMDQRKTIAHTHTHAHVTSGYFPLQKVAELLLDFIFHVVIDKFDRVLVAPAHRHRYLRRRLFSVDFFMGQWWCCGSFIRLNVQIRAQVHGLKNAAACHVYDAVQSALACSLSAHKCTNVVEKRIFYFSQDNKKIVDVVSDTHTHTVAVVSHQFYWMLQDKFLGIKLRKTTSFVPLLLDVKSSSTSRICKGHLT